LVTKNISRCSPSRGWASAAPLEKQYGLRERKRWERVGRSKGVEGQPSPVRREKEKESKEQQRGAALCLSG